MTSPLRVHWEAVARLVTDHRDVLDARPGAERGGNSDALVARGWSTFLLTLDAAALDELETGGLEATWPESAPPSLRALASEARAVGALPNLAPDSVSATTERGMRRGETPRKRAQVEAFAALLLPIATDASRVVDVGSGHGHLTRELAERTALPIVGLERDAKLAARARVLGRATASFAVTDVLRDGLALAAGDCVIGLHACGELGDAIVSTAPEHRASVALVGCCLQKRRGSSRRPLCASSRVKPDVPPSVAADAGPRDPLDLPRALLGLSNLTPGDEGVEVSRRDNLAGRERRLALQRLLGATLGATAVPVGRELDGLNRRAAQSDLHTLTARAFGLRALPVPSPRAIEEAALWARTLHGRMRRLSVPRAMLARALEVFVLLDRALYLEERGYAVAVGTLFPQSISARNLVLLAMPVSRG